jgi:hypothetical protein
MENKYNHNIFLYYAPLESEEITRFNFSNVCDVERCIDNDDRCENSSHTDFVDFISKIFEQGRFDRVWLFVYDIDEIIVTHKTDNLLHYIDCLGIQCNVDYICYLQEYESYESAYRVALSMKEQTNLCYDKRERKN